MTVNEDAGAIKRWKTVLVMTHQCHDVIGQIPSQVRRHKTREASEGNTCVILVGTAKILGKKKVRKVRQREKVSWGMNNNREIFAGCTT